MIEQDAEGNFFIDARYDNLMPLQPEAHISWKPLVRSASLYSEESEWHWTRYPWDRWADSWA